MSKTLLIEKIKFSTSFNFKKFSILSCKSCKSQLNEFTPNINKNKFEFLSQSNEDLSSPIEVECPSSIPEVLKRIHSFRENDSVRSKNEHLFFKSKLNPIPTKPRKKIQSNQKNSIWVLYIMGVILK